MRHLHSLGLNNCNPCSLYTCGWLSCDDSRLREDWHIQVLYQNKTRKKVKNMFNTRLYTFINTLDASFTINITVQAKERTTGIKISCKYYWCLCIFIGKSNDPKLQAFYVKYCIILIKVIKYAQTHHYSRLTEKFNNKI